jgi:hypothetical protein
MELFTVLIGGALMLLAVLVPGMALDLGFFPKQEPLERVATGFVLGLTPQFILYFLDKNFYVPVNMTTLTLTIFSVIIIGVAAYVLREVKHGKN